MFLWLVSGFNDRRLHRSVTATFIGSHQIELLRTSRRAETTRVVNDKESKSQTLSGVPSEGTFYASSIGRLMSRLEKRYLAPLAPVLLYL